MDLSERPQAVNPLGPVARRANKRTRLRRRRCWSSPRHLPTGPPRIGQWDIEVRVESARNDSVIIAAGYQAGQPPLVDDTVLLAMRPGACSSTSHAAPCSTPKPPSSSSTLTIRRHRARRVPDRALPRRRATVLPPAHRGHRPHRLPHQRLLRGRQPKTGRHPRQLPR